MSLYRMIASLLLVLTFSSSQGTAAAAKKIHTKKKAASRGPDRSLKLVNESGKAVEIFWVHPDTGDTTLMSDQAVMSGAFFPMNSFVGHEFQVREAPGKNGLCENSNDQEVDVDTYECRQVYLKVSENDNQVARITKEFEISFVDNKIEAHQQADSLVSDCQAASKKRLLQQGDSAVAAIEDLVKCVQGGVASALERVNEEIAFQAAVRMDIAGLLENYTCADDTLESTKDIDTQDWYDKLGGETLTVHLKHERRASRIHVIEHFIRPDECQAMEDSAVADLHHATVANGQGGSKRSESRKAMQAGIKVPWDEEKDANPIARLSRRVYDYTNHVLDLGIEEHGQEDLMSIQYFGRGKNDTSPDRYMPHCDGDCTGTLLPLLFSLCSYLICA
jgi:hypothetical protein